MNDCNCWSDSFKDNVSRVTGVRLPHREYLLVSGNRQFPTNSKYPQQHVTTEQNESFTKNYTYGVFTKTVIMLYVKSTTVIHRLPNIRKIKKPYLRPYPHFIHILYRKNQE